jgi:methylmalonyl-CoA mutase C-terminal domain/subunit
MEEKKLENVLLIGGGIIPKKDIESLEKSGVGKLYGPGTPVNETIDYITNWVEKNRR